MRPETLSGGRGIREREGHDNLVLTTRSILRHGVDRETPPDLGREGTRPYPSSREGFGDDYRVRRDFRHLDGLRKRGLDARDDLPNDVSLQLASNPTDPAPTHGTAEPVRRPTRGYSCSRHRAVDLGGGSRVGGTSSSIQPRTGRDRLQESHLPDGTLNLDDLGRSLTEGLPGNSVYYYYRRKIQIVCK